MGLGGPPGYQQHTRLTISSKGSFDASPKSFPDDSESSSYLHPEDADRMVVSTSFSVRDL